MDDSVIDWMTNHLTDRRQMTKVKGKYSKTTSVTCGIPQDSILGPLLFIIYINDLPDAIHDCKVSMYADDTAIYTANDDWELLEHHLQCDLWMVQAWLYDKKLTLNADKTKFTIFTTPQSADKFKDVTLEMGVRSWSE